jgi:cell wall-associated NlpC family hydrolase
LKDIKTKPKTIKRSLSPAEDIKTVMKRQYIRQKIAVKPQTSKPQQQEDKPENYATDAVENATHGLADTAYHQSKSYVQNKIKKHKAEKIREKETSATSSDTDLTEIITSQHNNTEKTGDSLHTDGELRNTPKQQNEDVLHNTSLPHEQRQQYVERKPKRQIEPISDAKRSTPHSEVDMPTAKTQVQVKTKDYYIKTHQQPRKAAYRLTPNTPKQNTPTSTLPYSNKNAVLKNKKSTFSLKHSARTDISKVKNMAVKTQKQITKQAAKQAVKRSAKVARQTAQATKTTVKATTRIAVKMAQAVVAMAKGIISSIAAVGGGTVLLVVLILIITVAAIAASPFGIFISEETNEGIPVSAIVAECNQEFTQKIEEIENANTYDHVEMQGVQADWSEVLAVFAVKIAGTDDDTAQDVVIIDENKKDLLKEVFWDMNSISSHLEQENEENISYITITSKTSDDMISEYRFTQRQQEALATLLENSAVLLSATQNLTIIDADAIDVLSNLPQNLSAERKAVVKAACSLVGKVNYFWGGKSSAIGWDSNWGKMMRVTADGSSTTGTMRPFGLDCSGFVTWTFINSEMSAGSIGHGTQGQIAKCTRLNWSNAQPGDLAFYNDLSHVGIVVGRDTSGNILIIHSNSSRNNVSLTTNSGFDFCAGPNVY